MYNTAIQTIQRESAISFPMFGNFSIDPPSYFTVFGINIYFYGVFVGLGFLLGILYCSGNSRRFGIKQDDVYDLMLWLIPCSIIGARLYFVLFRIGDYLANPIEIFAIRSGGLAIYGGVIAGVLTTYFVCRHKKIPVGAFLDLLAFGLLIGQILGRWGNFINREAFGSETDIFCRMGLTAPDGTTVFVHPTFLYESLWNLAALLFLSFWVRSGKRRYDGQCIILYFFLYGLGRVWIEGLRTDSLYIGGSGIRVSQALSAALIIVSLAILIVQSKRPHPPEALFVNQAAGGTPDDACQAQAAEAENKDERESGGKN